MLKENQPEQKTFHGNRKFTFSQFVKEMLPNIPREEFEPWIPSEILDKDKKKGVKVKPQQQLEQS